MSTEFKVSIGHLSSPTSENWNDLITGLLKPGIYSGGSIQIDSGFNILVEPFIARTENHTIRMTGDWYSLTIPGIGTYHIVAQVARNNIQRDEALLLVVSTGSLTDDMVELAKITIPTGALALEEDMIDVSSSDRKSLDNSTFFNRIFSGEGVFKDDNIVPHNLGHKKYSVLVTPDDATLSIGTISTDRDSSIVTINNSGPSRSPFTWTIIVHSDYDFAPGVIYGQVEVSNVATILTHNLGHSNYFPVLIPLEAPTDYYWVTKSDTTLTVETNGDPFRAIWAAMPTQATHINGTADYGDAEIIHNLGHQDYRVFVTSTTSGGPSKPYFIKEANRIVPQAGGTGAFQYLIIEDNKVLAGQLNFGSKANHYLNREDYIPLIQTTTDDFVTTALGKNSIYINSGVAADYAVIPASGGWALGDWSRPAIAPIASRIEINGIVNISNVNGEIIYKGLVTQHNYISRVMLQLSAPIIQAFDIIVGLFLNGTQVDTATITAGQTTFSNNFDPILVSLGAVAEIKLLSDSPSSSMLITWYGMGNIQLNSLGGLTVGAEALVAELTNGLENNYHYHDADRNRANHFGTQDAATTITGLGTAAFENIGILPGDVIILNGTGKIDGNLLPPIVISTPYPVADEAAMLALSQAEIGDIAIRPDGTFVSDGGDPSILATWIELTFPSAPVLSVAGKLGIVTLNAADITDFSTEVTTLANDAISATSFTFPYDLSFFVQSDVPDPEILVGSFIATRAITLTSGLTGSKAKAQIAPTGAVSYDIKVNGISAGSVDFAGASTTGTFTFTSMVNIIVDDVIELISPNAVGETIANVSITIVGCSEAVFCTP